MLYLLLAAFAALLLVVVFKLFGHYKVDSFQAIVINYFVCVITGCTTSGIFPFEWDMFQQPWIPYMGLLGLLFISGFYIASMTVLYFGVAVASVAQRMSLVISVTFAILFFNEGSSTLKVVGILTALLAVIFINIPPSKKEDSPLSLPAQNKWLILYPIGIFLISGVIEIVLQYVKETYHLKSEEQSIILFGAAAFLGVLVWVVLLVRGRTKLAWRNLIGGIALGIPNYFSIFFLLQALNDLKGSVVYPVNNILVVSSAAIVGYFFFKEKLSPINIVGVFLALLSILLIAL